MAVSNAVLLCDQSTIANFLAWAGFVSGNMSATAQCVQTADTGQVMLSGMSITGCTKSGTAVTYSYTTLTGIVPTAGRSLAITGMTNATNNGTFQLTASTNSGTTGTFTVTNASGVAESGSSGLVTKLTTVPTASNWAYDMWKFGDGLTDCFIKMEYGGSANNSATSPSVRVSIGASTNGAGLMPNSIGPHNTNASTISASTSAPFDCRFSGRPGQFCCMLFRGYTGGAQAFAVERSIDPTTGLYTGSYVTVLTAGQPANNSRCNQQSFSLLSGSPLPQHSVNTSSGGGFAARVFGGGDAINGNNGATVGFDNVAPYIGYWDAPMTSFALANQANFNEATIFNVSVYGVPRTYIATQTGNLGACTIHGNAAALCMRYD